MSLNGALNIGQSAIMASQAALQVVGNNMANAATPGYSRQVVHLLPGVSVPIGRGQFGGTGVMLGHVTRNVDIALQARLRSSVSDQHASLINQHYLSTMEVMQGELGSTGLSSELSAFFNSFSELGNTPEDGPLRSLVIQRGITLASKINDLQSGYQSTLREVDASLEANVEAANGLLDQVAQLNLQITQVEGASGQANGLRDQRDMILDELSQFMDISVVESENGSVDVLVGSIPVVLGQDNRGIKLEVRQDGDRRTMSINVAQDGSSLVVDSGAIGSLLAQRSQTIEPAMEQLDQLASQLIWQVNRLHSQGQGLEGLASVTGSVQVGDPAALIASADSGIEFPIGSGTFDIQLTDDQTGEVTTYQIQVNPSSMSVQDLVDSINASVDSPQLEVSINADGSLQFDCTDATVSFGNDSSGALAALGVNGFFSGSDAASIGVDQQLIDDPSRLAAASGFGESANGMAMQIAGLAESGIPELGGASITDFWLTAAGDLGVRVSAANAQVESTSIVSQSLYMQRQSVSGVSLDEEAVNLMSFQRQFQAAARYISVIDETMQTLLSIT